MSNAHRLRGSTALNAKHPNAAITMPSSLMNAAGIPGAAKRLIVNVIGLKPGLDAPAIKTSAAADGGDKSATTVHARRINREATRAGPSRCSAHFPSASKLRVSFASALRRRGSAAARQSRDGGARSSG